MQAARRLPLDRGHGRATLGLAGLLGEAAPQQLLAHPVHLERLVGGSNRGEHSVNGVEGAVGVVGGEVALVRPAVADLDELAHVAALGVAEHLGEHLAPLIHQRDEEELAVLGVRPPVAGHTLHPPVAVPRLALPGDERGEPLAQQIERLAHSFVVGGGHRSGLLFSLRPRSWLGADELDHHLGGTPEDPTCRL